MPFKIVQLLPYMLCPIRDPRLLLKLENLRTPERFFTNSLLDNQ